MGWQKGSGQAAGSSLLVSTTTLLNSAQVLALNNSGTAQLVPAPGAGKALVLQSAFCVYKASTVPFNGVTAGIQINYGSFISVAPATLLSGGWWDQVTSQEAPVAINADSAIPLTNVLNQPLTISYNGSDLNAGNGSVEITTYYTVVTP